MTLCVVMNTHTHTHTTTTTTTLLYGSVCGYTHMHARTHTRTPLLYRPMCDYAHTHTHHISLRPCVWLLEIMVGKTLSNLNSEDAHTPESDMTTALEKTLKFSLKIIESLENTGRGLG